MSDDDVIKEAADALVDQVADHELQDHGGEPCPAERINMLAYMTHRLGIVIPPAEETESREALLDLIRERALDYDAVNAEHCVEGT